MPTTVTVNPVLRASVTGDAQNIGAAAGQDALVLVDGSDTPITANGLASYTPNPGDRLLVARVGSQVEILQFLNTGTVPYNADFEAYKSTTDATLSTLQAGYDALSGLGAAGVQEDYMWVGDDPSLSTVKTVQISTFVQSALYAGDGATFASLMGLAAGEGLGDTTISPMTTFYTAFTNAGLLAMPYYQ